MSAYIGRFAPSPTGPLHAGSLVAALASWLDARAHRGTWLVRLEDVDSTRCLPGMGQVILQQLAQCSLQPDQPPLIQSQRAAAYQHALDALVQRGLAYPCGCSRKQIQAAQALPSAGKPRHGELIYPGTCRTGSTTTASTARAVTTAGTPNTNPACHPSPPQTAPVAWRLRTDVYIRNMPLDHISKGLEAIDSIVFPALPDGATPAPAKPITWADRRLGAQQQDVAASVGDFVLKRADGCFAYQLAVVVDDAFQGITDVVRGADLTDNTARQIVLQRALGLPTPRFLHTPLVLGANGDKLSKQNGAAALDLQHPLAALNTAAQVLGLPTHSTSVPQALLAWTRQWPTRW